MTLDRDTYFHRVQVSYNIARAIENLVQSRTGETWQVVFTTTFWFRLVDRTDPKTPRDYGYFVGAEELISKLARLHPLIATDLENLPGQR